MSEEEFDRAIDSAEDGYCLALIDEAERAREAEAELQMALDTLRGSIQSDCDDLAAKDAEIAALKKALGPTRGNRAAWQFRADKAEAERDAVQERLDAAEGELDTFEAELSRVNTALALANTYHDIAAKERSRETARADKAEAERDAAIEQYEECRQTNESVAVCAAHTSEITNSDGLHNNCYRCEVEEQTEKIERAEARADKAEEEIAALRRKAGEDGTAIKRKDGMWVIFDAKQHMTLFVGSSPVEAELHARSSRLAAGMNVIIEEADTIGDARRIARAALAEEE